MYVGRKQEKGRIGSVFVLEDCRFTQRIISHSMGDSFQLKIFSRIEELREALALRSGRPDFMLLDLYLPDGISLRLLEDFRFSGLALPPCFAMSASKLPRDRGLALSLGALDYLSKPIMGDEARLRIENYMSCNRLENRNFLGCSDLRLDLTKRYLYSPSFRDPKFMGKLQFKLLSMFLSNIETVFSREEIISWVWGRDQVVNDRSVDSLVRDVRKIIFGSVYQIESIYGAGYRIVKKNSNRTGICF